MQISTCALTRPFEVVEHRPQVQVVGLDVPEVPFTYVRFL